MLHNVKIALISTKFASSLRTSGAEQQTGEISEACSITCQLFWQWRKQIIRLHWQNCIPLVPLGDPS